MKLTTFKTTLALLAATGISQAAIIYVDADTSNTDLANGDPYAPTGSVINNDDLWSLRAFGNSGTVYTANDSNSNPGEDAPELRTTISGLSAGQSYNVFTYYWVGGNGTPSGNQAWDISTGLVQGATTDYIWNGGTLADAGDFTSAPLIVDSDRRLFQIDLGTAVADGSGEIHIYINDNPGNDDRTWYDGVGYEAIPEPSTSAMFGLAGLGLLLRRRR